MANIQIRHEGGCGHIEVDGVPLKGVAEATVKLEPRSLPVVEVRLIATESGMTFADGILKVGALDAPEALERALLAHLKAKYESDLLRLPVVHMGMDKASRPDMTAVCEAATFRVGEDGSLKETFWPWAASEGLCRNEPGATIDPMEATRALVKKHGGGSGG